MHLISRNNIVFLTLQAGKMKPWLIFILWTLNSIQEMGFTGAYRKSIRRKNHSNKERIFRVHNKIEMRAIRIRYIELSTIEFPSS